MHIFVARNQNATRYKLEGIGWIKHKPFTRLWTDCCRERRIAKNLSVQAYYDGPRFFCKDGKGCKK